MKDERDSELAATQTCLNMHVKCMFKRMIGRMSLRCVRYLVTGSGKYGQVNPCGCHDGQHEMNHVAEISWSLRGQMCAGGPTTRWTAIAWIPR